MKFAGSWYPEDRVVLTEMINNAVSKSVKLRRFLKGAILPNSAYPFSIKGIAPFFNNVDRETTHVFLFVTSHCVKLESDNFYFGNFEKYETPLGYVSGDKLFVNELKKFGDFVPMAVEKEYSAEIFYPFIKYFTPNARLTVLVIPSFSSQERLFALAKSFVSVADAMVDFDKSIFIASSEFTRYGKRFNFVPFGTTFHDSYKLCRSNDIKYIDNLISYDFDSLFRNMKLSHFNISGASSALFVSKLMQLMGKKGVMAEYYNSNDILNEISDDYICYSSILFG